MYERGWYCRTSDNVHEYLHKLILTQTIHNSIFKLAKTSTKSFGCIVGWLEIIKIISFQYKLNQLLIVHI